MSRAAVIALVLSCVGLGLMTAGIAYIYPPAALIFAGGTVAALGLKVLYVPPDKDDTR